MAGLCLPRAPGEDPWIDERSRPESATHASLPLQQPLLRSVDLPVAVPRRILWALWLFGGLLLVAGSYLAWGRGRTPPIAGPRAVASLEEVVLGGDPQWILVRGADREAPVVLFLHGGPGMPAMYLAHDFQRPLERDVVMVHWDRLGAGKSYEAGLRYDEFTVRRTLDDTHELAEALRDRFGGERIYLVGHSWGSYLGILAAAERPDLYAAYVGTGQMAEGEGAVLRWRRDWLRDRARRDGDAELLERLGEGAEVTEDDLFRYGGELHGSRSFWPILLTGLLAPEYTLGDVANVRKGASRLETRMRGDDLPLRRRVSSLEIPVFFFLGRHDANTPSPQAAAYLRKLDAPSKEVVWFDDSAHFPFWEQPERFHQAMLDVLERVGPRGRRR